MARQAETWRNTPPDRAARKAAIARHPCECKKPENKDGGMPAKWWA